MRKKTVLLMRRDGVAPEEGVGMENETMEAIISYKCLDVCFVRRELGKLM